MVALNVDGRARPLPRYPPAMPKLTPKIILEGTRLTHKTDLAFALNEHPAIVGPRRYRYHSPLISAEWCGFTPEPWGRGPITFDGPEEETQALAVFDAWARLIELQPHYSWIIDRFHLSARAYQLQAHGTDVDFDWLEERLCRPRRPRRPVHARRRVGGRPRGAPARVWATRCNTTTSTHSAASRTSCVASRMSPCCASSRST